MPDFLLEILSEEIPARMQLSIAEAAEKLACVQLTKHNIQVEVQRVRCLISPRRIALFIKDLPQQQELPATERLGPRVSSEAKVIEGFLKSVGLSKISELKTFIPAGKKEEYFLFTNPAQTVPTAQLLQNFLPKFIAELTSLWPKLMKWDEVQLWIRPVRSLLCLFGSDIIEFEYFGHVSNRHTYGHQLLGNPKLTINNADQYQATLLAASVVVDQKQRKQIILDQIALAEPSLKLKVDLDQQLLNEVVGLCEHPTVLVGSIDEKFMSLPSEVLSLTLKIHQRYFSTLDQNNTIAAKFVFASDALIDDRNRAKIISDNEKVMRARLFDAQFFIEEDLKQPLASYDTKNIIFHQKLGSIHDKVERLAKLAKFLTPIIPQVDSKQINRAINLCKNDLATKAVAELPELQGRIGSFYAKKQNEDPQVATAIYEHYLPFANSGPDSKLPSTAAGITIAIADKIDSIAGLFLVNEAPTSSRDPLALRRSALGIIKIILGYELALSLKELIQKALSNYSAATKNTLPDEILKFFVDRLRFYLKEEERLKIEVINVITDQYLEDYKNRDDFDISALAKRIRFINSIISDQKILPLYKRVASILAIEEKKLGKKLAGEPAGLKTKEELELHKAVKQIDLQFAKLVAQGELSKAFEMLDALAEPITNFFAGVLVNDENEEVKKNRLFLLAEVRALFHQLADFSKI